MLPLPTILIFLLAALVLLVVPGPAVLYITTRGITHGRKAALSSVLGIELASLCHSIFVAFGLSAILVTSALAYNFVKYLGAAYLVYLGLKTLLSKKAVFAAESTGSLGSVQMFRKGFLVNLLNPKTALFFYAFLPQFVDPARGSSVLQILFLGGLFVSLATITDTTYALLSSSLGAVLLDGNRFTGFIDTSPAEFTLLLAWVLCCQAQAGSNVSAKSLSRFAGA